jgi:parallel beta-helix repeat protein
LRNLSWLLLIIAVLVSSMLLVADVHAATYVNGPISTDTTWTKTNSPYRLTGNVSVESGVVLTIEPGVTVDFYAYTLQVTGTLNAIGISDNNIILFSSYSINPTAIYFTYSSTNWSESTGTGSIIENSVLSSACISTVNCSPKISNNYFTNNRVTSISVSGGSPLILNNAFDIRATGISITSGSSASPIISGNFIKCNSVSSNFGINAGNNNAYISENNITGCYTGIYATGNSTITRNLIRSNTNGISVSGSMATIENNIISSNSYGINGGGIVRNNTIGNNQVGILASIGSSNISQNNIFSNTQFSISMSTPNSIDAINNWWGTMNISVINQTIYDYKNSTMFGRVAFTPILNDLNSAAPALESINYIPIPTPTPFPTPIPVPTNAVFIPRPTATLNPISTLTPRPDPTITPTVTPTLPPTPSPTPKIMPGSPLSLGGSTFAETLSQFDLMGIAKLVLIALGIMWIIVILSYVDRKFAKKNIRF